MFFAPTQGPCAVAEYIDFKLIAFRTRHRDRVFAIIRHQRHLKMDQSANGSIRERVSFNEAPS